MKLGDIIIIPLDNMYAFAAQLYDDQALEKIFKLTGQSVFEPLPLIINNLNQLDHFVDCDASVKKVLFEVWPGPLVGIFKTSEMHKKLTGDAEVQISMPINSIAKDMIKQFGVLSVAAVLDSNHNPILDQEVMYQRFNHLLINVYTNDKNNISSEEPTLVDFRENKIEILRNGPITATMLEKIKKSLSK